MNRLQFEASPYLRQHADNPVDWHPWGAEALERSQLEQKPLLVSIGYATCHWCHVMEKESFRDPDVAALMNAFFINVKVDREERPDLDQLFMQACQAITGSGGWPLHVFLTPDGRPFFAGTYFPPAPGAKTRSWVQALELTAYNFFEQRPLVEKEADRVEARLKGAAVADSLLDRREEEAWFTGSQARRLFDLLTRQMDEAWGGFGEGKKFPNTMGLEFLLHYAHTFGSDPALHHLHFTLEKMAAGGIYDFVGGGWARYTVDRTWKEPHFEKMLYDNALMAGLLADVALATEDEGWAPVLRQTIGFVGRELGAGDGGFYAALDADSQGEEGRFYTWSWEELESALGEDLTWFSRLFEVREAGNFEGRNILYRRQSFPEFAAGMGWKDHELEIRLRIARNRLLEARKRRPQPVCDTQRLLSWNALYGQALVKAFRATGDERYGAQARALLQYLREHHQAPAGRLRRIAGEKGPFAFLDDYTAYVAFLLEAYLLDFDRSLLEEALQWTEVTIERFRDPGGNLLFLASGEDPGLFFRVKEVYDSEMPSGNALLVHNLQKLAGYFQRRDLHDRAQDILRTMWPYLEQDPLPFAAMATNLLREVEGLAEIVVIGPEARRLGRAVSRRYLPGAILLVSDMPGPDTDPLLAHRWVAGQTLIYLCRNNACRHPVESLEELAHELKH